MKMTTFKSPIDLYHSSNGDVLLFAGLLCGLTPEKNRIHRLQLFFCANFVVGKRSAEEDFQRSIETEVNRDNAQYWTRHDRAVYELTPIGFKRARTVVQNVRPMYSPAKTLSDVRYKLSGCFSGHQLSLERQGRAFRVIIDHREFRNSTEAAAMLGLRTDDTSAARVLYNLAVKHGFAAIA
jgi:hypothetical protein